MPPPIRDSSGLTAALCLALFGAYVTYTGSQLSYTGDVGPGPGFFPLWIGVGLLLFSIYQTVVGVAAARPASESAHSLWQGSGRALTGWLAMAASIFLYRWSGFAISFILLTIFFIVVIERRAVLPALAIGAGLALVFHLLFVVALGVSLPAGPWGF